MNRRPRDARVVAIIGDYVEFRRRRYRGLGREVVFVPLLLGFGVLISSSALAQFVLLPHPSNDAAELVVWGLSCVVASLVVLRFIRLRAAVEFLQVGTEGFVAGGDEPMLWSEVTSIGMDPFELDGLGVVFVNVTAGPSELAPSATVRMVTFIPEARGSNPDRALSLLRRSLEKWYRTHGLLASQIQALLAANTPAEFLDRRPRQDPLDRSGDLVE